MQIMELPHSLITFLRSYYDLGGHEQRYPAKTALIITLTGELGSKYCNSTYPI
jgi:hypothetical protein